MPGKPLINWLSGFLFLERLKTDSKNDSSRIMNGKSGTGLCMNSLMSAKVKQSEQDSGINKHTGISRLAFL